MQVIDLGAWTPYLEQELRAPYFAALLQRVGAARAAGTVYPPEERTFFALTATPPERVRAVILGYIGMMRDFIFYRCVFLRLLPERGYR